MLHLCCGSLLPAISVAFHLMRVRIIFSSGWVAEWSPLGKQLLTRLTLCSLCLNTCDFSYFLSRFEGWVWVLIASVPDLRIHVTLL